jgi:hypothetical protein
VNPLPPTTSKTGSSTHLNIDNSWLSHTPPRSRWPSSECYPPCQLQMSRKFSS